MYFGVSLQFQNVPLAKLRHYLGNHDHTGPSGRVRLLVSYMNRFGKVSCVT